MAITGSALFCVIQIAKRLSEGRIVNKPDHQIRSKNLPCKARDMCDSNIWLYELAPDGADFTCRLAGEDINQTWGGNIAGRPAKSLFGPEDYKIVADIWHAVLETPKIYYAKAEKMQRNSMYAAERIVLPLRSEASDPIRGYILGASLYSFSNLGNARPERILTNAFHILCSDIA